MFCWFLVALGDFGNFVVLCFVGFWCGFDVFLVFLSLSLVLLVVCFYVNYRFDALCRLMRYRICAFWVRFCVFLWFWVLLFW